MAGRPEAAQRPRSAAWRASQPTLRRTAQRRTAQHSAAQRSTAQHRPRCAACLQVGLAARGLGVQDVGQEGHQAQLLRLHLLSSWGRDETTDAAQKAASRTRRGELHRCIPRAASIPSSSPLMLQLQVGPAACLNLGLPPDLQNSATTAPAPPVLTLMPRSASDACFTQHCQRTCTTPPPQHSPSSRLTLMSKSASAACPMQCSSHTTSSTSSRTCGISTQQDCRKRITIVAGEHNCSPGREHDVSKGEAVLSPTRQERD